MTIQTYTLKDFIQMPWKNGTDVTTELFALNDPKDNSLLFRLSMASVTSDGPFSNYPGIDRILFLLKGKGFYLESSQTTLSLGLHTPPHSFSGEESINCILLDGPCVDFNIMTARSYAKSTISFVNTPIVLRAKCDFKFIYDKEREELYKLDLGDELMIKEVIKNLIIIDVVKLK